MANGTIQPPRQEDERDVARRQFEDLTDKTYRPREVDLAESSQAANLQDQEQAAVEGAEQNTKEAAGGQAKNLEESPSNVPQQIPYTPSSGNKQSGGGLASNIRNRRNQILAAIGIITSLLGAMGAIFSSVPNFADLAMHNPAAKFTRAIMSRRERTLEKRYFENEDCTGTGIICKAIKEHSAKEIAAFKEAGILKDDGIAHDANGKPYIDHFVAKDETTGLEVKVDKTNIANFYESNPEFKAAILTFSKPDAIIARSAQSLKLTVGKIHANLRAPLGDESVTEKIKAKFREYVYKNTGDPRFKPGGAADEKVDEEIQKAVTDGPSIIDDTDSLKGTLKGALSGAHNWISKLQGPAGIATDVCDIYGGARKVVIGAKEIKSLALIKYALMFFTVFEAVKAGHGNITQVAFLVGILMTASKLHDSLGKTFFNSPEKEAMLDGTFSDSNDLARFAVASPLIKGFQQAVSYFRSAEVTRSKCAAVGNPFTQGAFILIGIVSAIFSGGEVTIASFAGQAALGFALSFAISYTTAWLIKYAAGTIAPDFNDPGGGFAAGQAMFAGITALTAFTGRAVGFRPLTKAQFAETAISTEPEIASLDAMDHLNKNPFSLNESDSITNQFAYAIAPYVAAPLSSNTLQNMASLFTSPFSMVASSAGSMLLRSAHAATLVDLKSNYCKDQDYQDMGLTVDAGCGVVHGLTDDEIDISAKDSLKYMQDNDHINDDGTAKSNEFKNYLKDCPDGTTPYTPDGGGLEVTDDVNTKQCYSDDQKYKEFRAYANATNMLKAGSDDLDGKLGTTLDSGL